jgi:hypothetical protein
MVLDEIKHQLALAGPKPERPAADLVRMREEFDVFRTQAVGRKSQLQTLDRQLRDACAKQQQRDQAADCPTCGQPLTEAAKSRMFGELAANSNR